MGHDLRLGVDDARRRAEIGARHLAVIVLPAGSQLDLIGGFVNQRVPEGIGRARADAAWIDDVRLGQFAQPIVQLLAAHERHTRQDAYREFAADDGGDLGDGLADRQAIEARGQQAVQGPRNVEILVDIAAAGIGKAIAPTVS